MLAQLALWVQRQHQPAQDWVENLPTRDDAVTFVGPLEEAKGAIRGYFDLAVPAAVEQAVGKWGELPVRHEVPARHSCSGTHDAAS